MCQSLENISINAIFQGGNCHNLAKTHWVCDDRCHQGGGFAVGTTVSHVWKTTTSQAVLGLALVTAG